MNDLSHTSARFCPSRAVPICALGTLAGAVFLLLGGAGCARFAPAEQPVAFKHKIHVAQEEIPCTECHIGVEVADHATIPRNEKCLECHEDPLGDTPEEARLIELLQSGEPIPWHRVTRVAEHVHFSHRRHVVAGGIICETCHGQVPEMEAPFREPFIRFRREIGMQKCIACHLSSGNPRATVDCALCHR